LAQIIIGRRESSWIALLQREVTAKEQKYTENFLKSSPDPASQNESNLEQIILR
jgi:hypothetical protein